MVSNAGDGDARKQLTEMEQLRFVLGGMLGKEPIRREELDALWPITLVLFDSGDEITVTAGDDGIRFLLVSGRPLEEPVAWYGPIVMNTKAELQTAFNELRSGTFIKHAR